MRCSVAKWLWCLWRVQRVYRARGLMFSQRKHFLDELRPFVAPSSRIASENRIAWPDAIFWITPADVDRAITASRRRDL